MSFENPNMYKRGREYKRREAGKANLLRVAAACGFLAVAITLFMAAANYAEVQFQHQSLINSWKEIGSIHTVLFDCVVLADTVQSMPESNTDEPLARNVIIHTPLLIQTEKGPYLGGTIYNLRGEWGFVSEDSPNIRKDGPCFPAQATITRYEDRNLLIANITTTDGSIVQGIARATLNENK